MPALACFPMIIYQDGVKDEVSEPELDAAVFTVCLLLLSLESISRNRFGRNLQTKSNLVKFRFLIITLIKNSLKSNIIVHFTRMKLHTCWLGRNLSKV
jgi:hypothetical protein